VRAASLLLAAVIVCAAGSSRADNKDYLSCQQGLKLPSCTAVTGLWPVSIKLHVAVKCQVCSGGGSSTTCTPQSVKAADLSVETGGGVDVSGAFSSAGSCSGLPLFSFSGALKPSSLYHVVAKIGSFGSTALIDLKTSSASAVSDSGVPPKTDKGAAGDDGAPTTDSAATADGGAGASGDGAGLAEDESGCSCRVAARDPRSSLPLLLLGAAFLLVVRRWYA
jgi:MYXO-CTERM domain-containing protein